MSADRLARAETELGHHFADPARLELALTHRSAAQGRRPQSNERLEFLGDRVLGLLVAEWLIERFPAEPEGKLGPRLAHLVSGEALASIGGEIGFSELLALGPGEAASGAAALGRVTADALEAALGALYLDGGLEAARRFVRRAWNGAMERQTDPPRDPKTSLQEFALARGTVLPAYEIVSQEGPSHAPRFVVMVQYGGASGTGEAGSKRAAERAAAADLLAKLP